MFKQSPFGTPSRARKSLSPQFASPCRPRFLPSLSPPRPVHSLLSSVQQRTGNSTLETQAPAVIRQFILPMLEKNALKRFADSSIPTLTAQLTAKIAAATQELASVRTGIGQIQQDSRSSFCKLSQLRQQLQTSRRTLAMLQTQQRARTVTEKTVVEPVAIRRAEALARAMAEERAECERVSGQTAQAVLRGSLLSMQNTIMGAQIKSLVASMKALTSQETLETRLDSEVRQIFQTVTQGLHAQYNSLGALHLLNSLNLCTRVGNNKKCKERQVLKRSIYQIKQQTNDCTRRLQRKLNALQLELGLKLQLVDHLASKVTELNVLHARDKETLRMQLARSRRGEDEQVCVVCKKTYWESQNFQWSCSVHASEWNGTMYWCCGQYSVSHPGCVKAKHISQEEAEALQQLIEGTVICSSCSSSGHLKEACPFDPNVRGASWQELERVSGLRRSKARRNQRFTSRLRCPTTNDEVEDELELTKKAMRLAKSLSPPANRFSLSSR